MEDRYEIRGKIGQGGLGTVYRGYDMRMKREVAIKRIASSMDDESLQEEATKQLEQEAGALASLQHPHIVTIYDVGADEDGQFVVMELINGKTLDEIIENAPLTWQDFRELAMQSQEALIAAHELDMIHSDLKPPNIMLTWLPSGKFQIKIVDFGLAVLQQNQSQEEIEELETVFGSIFFMPPEQFEREVLDVRSDLYSMGCVYYQALTGTYPFNGETGNEVMDAHLNHTVTPIQEIREGIPVWLCDWVMWHINRDREDRPASAREALSVFLQNDVIPDPEMSRGNTAGARPRLIIPGAAPPENKDASVVTGVPIKPPTNTTSIHFTADSREDDLKKSKTAPQPLAPPAGSKPSVHTSMVAASAQEAKPQAASALTGPSSLTSQQATQSGEEKSPGAGEVYIAPVVPAAKQGMSTAFKGMIAVVLTILVVVFGMILVNRSKHNKITERMNHLKSLASNADATEVIMNRKDIDTLLHSASFTGEDGEREVIYHALYLAKPSDNTDVDRVIVEYVTTQQLLPDVRNKLIGEVLSRRKNPDVVPLLLDYAEKTKDVTASVASLKAVRDMVSDRHADHFLELLTETKEGALRKEAEANLAAIVQASDKPSILAKRMIQSYDKSGNAVVKHALIRLLGRCGTDNALEKIRDALASDDANTRLSATVALSEWRDVRAIEMLLDYLSGLSDPSPRIKAFDALIKIASQPFALEDANKAKQIWTRVCSEAKTSQEKIKVINAIVIIDANWPKPMVQSYTKDKNSAVASRAGKGITYIADREALKKKEKQ